MQKLGLIGNPNCGKSTLFNTLTGGDARVGNWPGITVERKEDVWKKEGFLCVDLPGIYSFSPYTPEERVAFGFILEEKPDAFIQIVDSTALERSLYLTTQLIELDLPVVLALNMKEVAEKQGVFIDALKLSASLGIPVVEISAITGEGQEELTKALRVALQEGQAVGKTLSHSYAFFKQTARAFLGNTLHRTAGSCGLGGGNCRNSLWICGFL